MSSEAAGLASPSFSVSSFSSRGRGDGDTVGVADRLAGFGAVLGGGLSSSSCRDDRTSHSTGRVCVRHTVLAVCVYVTQYWPCVCTSHSAGCVCVRHTVLAVCVHITQYWPCVCTYVHVPSGLEQKVPCEVWVSVGVGVQWAGSCGLSRGRSCGRSQRQFALRGWDCSQRKTSVEAEGGQGENMIISRSSNEEQNV